MFDIVFTVFAADRQYVVSNIFVNTQFFLLEIEHVEYPCCFQTAMCLPESCRKCPEFHFRNLPKYRHLMINVFRWFKFTLEPPYSIVHDKLRLAIWDTSFLDFLGGLSLHLNHLIESRMTNYDWPSYSIAHGKL